VSGACDGVGGGGRINIFCGCIPNKATLQQTSSDIFFFSVPSHRKSEHQEVGMVYRGK